MAFAAGIMVYISLDEILPTPHAFGEEHLVIVGTVAGMVVMAASVLLIIRRNKAKYFSYKLKAELQVLPLVKSNRFSIKTPIPT